MSIQSQITAELGSIFNDGLAISIIHTYGVDTEALTVFFDNTFETALEGDLVETASPSILLLSSTTGNITRSSKFTINGTDYYIIEQHPDIEGLTQIDLSKHQVT